MKKRLLSMFLCLILCLSLLPAGVLAAETPPVKEVMVGASAIQGEQKSKIYYGHYLQSLAPGISPKDRPDPDEPANFVEEPILWRTLSTFNIVSWENSVAYSNDYLFLTSDQLLDLQPWHAAPRVDSDNGEVETEEIHGATWSSSTIRSWLNGYGPDQNLVHKDYSAPGNNFISRAFTPEEAAMIPAAYVWNEPNYMMGIFLDDPDTEDQIYLLSMREVGALEEESGASYPGFGCHNRADREAFPTDYARSRSVKLNTGTPWLADGVTDYWFLRNYGLREPEGHYRAVRVVGNHEDSGVVDTMGPWVLSTGGMTRPAMNLLKSDVLLTSAAVGGKSTVVGELQQLQPYAEDVWKMTLKLPDYQGFTVADQTIRQAKAGDSLTISYTGAHTADNDYISAVLVETATGEVLYYGKLAQPRQADGTVTVELPDSLADGAYELRLFNEQCNGDKNTDFASDFQTIPVMVPNAPKQETPAITISYGAERLEGFLQGESYTVQGEAVTPDENGGISAQPYMTGEPVEIVLKTNGVNRLDSEPQSLVVPARPAAPSLTYDAARGGVVVPENYQYNLTTGDLTADGWVSGTGKLVQVEDGNRIYLCSAAVTEGTTPAFRSQVQTLEGQAPAASESAPAPKPAEKQVEVTASRDGTLPMEPVKADDGTEIIIHTHSDSPIAVEVPVQAPTAGTVAVLVRKDGTEQVIRKTALTEDGLRLQVEDGDVIRVVDNTPYFEDTRDHWAGEAIAFVTSRELYQGTGPAVFSPDQGMSRAMLTRVLHNLENNPNPVEAELFEDVAEDSWYTQSILWAAENGIVTGISELKFAPDLILTREQLITMLWRYAGCPTAAGTLTFADSGAISSYAVEAMKWAVEKGLITGVGDNLLAPQATATRAQVAAILMRYLNQ